MTGHVQVLSMVQCCEERVVAVRVERTVPCAHGFLYRVGCTDALRCWFNFVEQRSLFMLI